MTILVQTGHWPLSDSGINCYKGFRAVKLRSGHPEAVPCQACSGLVHMGAKQDNLSCHCASGVTHREEDLTPSHRCHNDHRRPIRDRCRRALCLVAAARIHRNGRGMLPRPFCVLEYVERGCTRSRDKGSR
jgi:hypothetical protein